MAFIKDTINVKIFLLVVLVLVSMVSLLIVFKNSFDDVTARYTNKTLELNKTFERLSGTEVQLNKTMDNLQLKSLKEEDLRTKYTQLRDERDLLVGQKNQLLKDVDDKNKQVLLLDGQLIIFNQTITDLNRRINLLRKENDCLKTNGTNC